jgi:uncharacterized FlaG/YvyC family protein
MTNIDPDRIGASPPAELQQAFATAQQVAAELDSQRVNLHFDVDDETGRVRVELIDSSGEVLREIPATHLLDALSDGDAWEARLRGAA